MLSGFVDEEQGVKDLERLMRVERGHDLCQ